MFAGLGMGEIIVIAAVALVILGPDQFPRFTKMVMRTIRDLRGYVDEVKRDVGKELDPVKKELSDLSRYNPEDYVEKLTDSIMNEDEASEEDDSDPNAHKDTPAWASDYPEYDGVHHGGEESEAEDESLDDEEDRSSASAGDEDNAPASASDEGEGSVSTSQDDGSEVLPENVGDGLRDEEPRDSTD